MCKKCAKLKLNIGCSLRNLKHADLRVRALRGSLQGLRRQVQPAPSSVACAAHEMPVVPQTGAKNYFSRKLADKTEAAFHFGCKKGGLHRPEKGGQRRVRAAVISARFRPVRRDGQLSIRLEN